MKVFIGSDHAGFELKEKLIPYIQELGHTVEDKGAFELDEKDDYPDFVKPVAIAISENPDSKSFRGIVLGKSGQGEAMCANKYKDVRAAEFYGQAVGEESIVKLSREHNDSNVLSLGAGFLSEDEAKVAIKLWLETEFSGDVRHERRIRKIENADA